MLAEFRITDVRRESLEKLVFLVSRYFIDKGDDAELREAADQDFGLRCYVFVKEYKNAPTEEARRYSPATSVTPWSVSRLAELLESN